MSETKKSTEAPLPTELPKRAARVVMRDRGVGVTAEMNLVLVGEAKPGERTNASSMDAILVFPGGIWCRPVDRERKAFVVPQANVAYWEPV